MVLVGFRIWSMTSGKQSRSLDSIHLLDTRRTPPAPRIDHSAAVHGDRYLLIFGGCSHSVFFSDLHILDLQTKEWLQPEIRGDAATSRAGHAGVSIGENWYLVGGGDSKNGCLETLILDMAKLVRTTLTSVKEGDPLTNVGIFYVLDFLKAPDSLSLIASLHVDTNRQIGLSVCTALIAGEKYLIAFGGYNGKYQNEVFVMKPKPRDSVHPKNFQSPDAAAAAASVTAAYALMSMEKPNPGGIDNIAEIDEVRVEKKVIEATLKHVRDEVVSLKEKVDEVNSTHSVLSKELFSVQGQLANKRSRCFKLEAQISELHKILEPLPSLENEVLALRKQKSEFDQHPEHTAAVTRQSSGGFLSWLSGSS